MKYLLDTNVVSDFVRGDRAVQASLRQHSSTLLCVSTVTVMEIDYGLALVPGRGRRLSSIIRGVLDSIHVLPFSVEDARAAGVVRAALRRRGTAIGPYDVMLAGCALARGLVLVTANTAEFARVESLTIETWRD